MAFIWGMQVETLGLYKGFGVDFYVMSWFLLQA